MESTLARCSSLHGGVRKGPLNSKMLGHDEMNIVEPTWYNVAKMTPWKDDRELAVIACAVATLSIDSRYTL